MTHSSDRNETHGPKVDGQVSKATGALIMVNTLLSKLTLKSPWCKWERLSFLCFFIEDMEDNRLPPWGLLEEVRSSPENLCFDASEMGETGDRSIFSFLFIGVAKLEMEITVMDGHKCHLGGNKHFIYYEHYPFQFTGRMNSADQCFIWKQLLQHEDQSSRSLFSFILEAN